MIRRIGLFFWCLGLISFVGIFFIPQEWAIWYLPLTLVSVIIGCIYEWLEG